MKLYRTRTQKEYDWLMKKLEAEGYKWISGDKPTEDENSRKYTNEAIVYADKGSYLTWDRIKDVENEYLNKIIEVSDLMGVTDPLMAKVMERNNKPTKTSEHNSIQPDHYKNGDKDLFDEWHERYYHSEKTYTGREVFVEIMKSVAERYARRYPNKNEEDLEKAVYTLERLREYEESEE